MITFKSQKQGSFLSSHQYVKITPPSGALFFAVDCKLDAAPANVVVEVPDGFALLDMRQRQGDGVILDLNADHEWKAKVDDFKRAKLYCAAKDLSSFCNQEDCEVCAPYDVDIKVEDDMIIPAKVSVRMRYELRINSLLQLANAYKNCNELNFENLHDEIRPSMMASCKVFQKELSVPRTKNEICALVERVEARETVEKQVNRDLGERGMVANLSLSVTDPFDRMGNNAWSQYLENRIEAVKGDLMIERMKNDAQKLEQYSKTVEAAQQVFAAQQRSEKKGK